MFNDYALEGVVRYPGTRVCLPLGFCYGQQAALTFDRPWMYFEALPSR